MIVSLPHEYIIGIGAGIVILILAGWVFQLERTVRAFIRGKNGASLEEILQTTLAHTEHILQENKDIVAYCQNLDEKMKSTVQGVATVRFNPFKNSGSNQSFATAFINKHGDGVVISSLYSRERVSIFAKPIQEMTSSYELTNEEKQALDQARASIL